MFATIIIGSILQKPLHNTQFIPPLVGRQRKAAQDQVYLYVLRCYILYGKTVFQWRPGRSGGILAYYLLNN